MRDLAAASAQADRLADSRARQAAALREVEARVQASADSLAMATQDEARAEASLEATQSRFAILLPVMLRLSQYPEETVLAVPAPQEQALQGLLITRGLAITLNRQAARLRADQSRARAMRTETASRAALLAQERLKQAALDAELDRMVAEARTQVTQVEMEGRDAALQGAAAAARATTLRDAIAAMDAQASMEAAQAAHQAALASVQRRAGAGRAALAREAAVTRPPGSALSAATGQLLVPVAGLVMRAFGAQAEDGPATGITYATVAGAYVSAPCRARVAFAAPFRRYGQLVILECGGGYDIVLAGMASIAVSPGHAVRPGEPLGRMPDARAGLYVELRAKGRPIDPAPFLKAKL